MAAALLLQLFGLRFLRDIMADVNSAARTTWKNERIDYGYDSSPLGTRHDPFSPKDGERHWPTGNIISYQAYVVKDVKLSTGFSVGRD
jgi:hypothetical protein